MFLGDLLIRNFKWLLLATVFLGACSKGPKAVQVPQPAPAIDLSTLPQTADVIPAEVPTEIPAGSSFDGIGGAIVEARIHFEEGSELYQKGSMKLAKEQFDAAIDALLAYSANEPGSDRIRREMTDMVARIHALEIAAIRNGDGFSDADEEHAAIDDLEQVATFPAPIDPRLKQAVEEEVQRAMHDLPIEINDRVLSFLEYYHNGRGRKTMAVGLERAGKYRPMIERILMEEEVPLDLLHLAQAESAFLPKAVSRAKARGMWQFISSRGQEYGLRQNGWIDERSDPEKATRAAARHLRDLYEEFDDWYLAMAAYNAGPFRVESALRKTGASSFWELADRKALPRETINYVPTIVAQAIIGRNPEKYGFEIVPDDPLETDRIRVSEATDLRVIADALSVPVERIKELNPQLLKWTTPPNDSDFELILPKGYGEPFEIAMSGLSAADRVLWQHHEVKKGETLSVIARKYGVTVTDISQVNSISTKQSLIAGQELLIPLSGNLPGTAAAASPAAKAAAATSKAPVPMPGKADTYVVRRGDTLSLIAANFKTSVENLKEWNGLSSANQINAGTRLLVSRPVPDPTKMVRHKVREGETLNKIAAAYNISVDAILAWNKTDDLSVIHPGDQITIFVGN